MKVEISGAYADGHTYERIVELPEPSSLGEDFWDEVFNLTGDGHFDSNGASVDSYDEATVIESSNPAFVGESMSWQG